MSQHEPQGQVLKEAIRALDGHWLGSSWDVLYFHPQQQLYEFSHPDLQAEHQGFKAVADFKSFSAELSRQHLEPPMEFGWYAVPVAGIPAFDKMGSEMVEFDPAVIHKPAASSVHGARLSLQWPTEDDVVVLQGVFADTYVEQDGLHYRKTQVKPYAANIRTVTLKKEGRMFINEREGLTPWALQDIRKKLLLPDAIKLLCQYDPYAVKMKSVLFDASQQQVLCEFKDTTPLALNLIEQQMQRFSVKGDLLHISLSVPAEMKTDTDGEQLLSERYVGMELNTLIEEIERAVKVCVEHGLSGYQVDIADFHERLVQIVRASQQQDDDVVENVYGVEERTVQTAVHKDSFHLDIGLHQCVIATADLVGVVRDAMVEVAPKGSELTVTATRRSEVERQQGLLQHYRETSRAMGTERAGRALSEEFVKEELSWTDAMQSLPEGVRQKFLSAETFFSTKNEIATLLVEAALANQGFVYIAKTLPSQANDHRLAMTDSDKPLFQPLKTSPKVT